MSKKCKYYCYKKTRPDVKQKTDNLKKIGLVVFDMDGVLIDTMSSWKYLHDYYGTNNEQSVDDYLKGNIDDLEFIRRDVSLWLKKNKIIKKEKIVEILSVLPIMKGAEEFVSFLKDHNIKTAIVSAGLNMLAERAKNELGIDYAFSNGVKIDENGNLSDKGVLGVKLMYKDENIKFLSKKINIPYNEIAAVGNSCFDIPMFEICGLGIAFNPEDDCTREAADFVVEDKDLSNIIPFISNYL